MDKLVDRLCTMLNHTLIRSYISAISSISELVYNYDTE